MVWIPCIHKKVHRFKAWTEACSTIVEGLVYEGQTSSMDWLWVIKESIDQFIVEWAISNWCLVGRKSLGMCLWRQWSLVSSSFHILPVCHEASIFALPYLSSICLKAIETCYHRPEPLKCEPKWAFPHLQLSYVFVTEKEIRTTQWVFPREEHLYPENP